MKSINILFKNKLFYIVGFTIIICNACNDLDLAPLSTASTENWYSTDEEFQMALNNLYDLVYWNEFDDGGSNWLDFWADDMIRRADLTTITSGALGSGDARIRKFWIYRYEAIQNANRIIGKLGSTKEISEENKIKYEAEAKFHRAANYSKLIFYWGDVPFYSHVLTPEEAFLLARKDKYEILQEIYKDFDFAVENLPVKYTGNELQKATKGAALALKARIALYMGDYTVALNAAKACINLGVYKLYPEYQDLFSKNSRAFEEIIFSNPRSQKYNVTRGPGSNQVVARTNGGANVFHPSWQLFASFLCTDGLPIDESPLFNPREPFKNRDPRCGKVLVEFGTELDGVTYEPHPDSLYVYNSNTGEYLKNRDTRGNDLFAAFNGLTWRKWVNGETVDWIANIAEPINIVIRYADILLIYAEAKIELNEIDQSVLDAINQVRARAYGENLNSSAYPKVTTHDQAELRKQLRIERRMELPFEGMRRYCDIVRWGLTGKIMNMWTYGILSSAKDLRNKVVVPGLWFWPETPPIDEDGVAQFEETNMLMEGKIRRLAKKVWPERQNLWPIPTSEIQINENLIQNPGY